MIGCLRTRVCKQPIIALYFESETELKFYNLEARYNTYLKRMVQRISRLYMYKHANNSNQRRFFKGFPEDMQGCKEAFRKVELNTLTMAYRRDLLKTTLSPFDPMSYPSSHVTTTSNDHYHIFICNVTINCVQKHIRVINTANAQEPGRIANTMLKACAIQHAPALTLH